MHDKLSRRKTVQRIIIFSNFYYAINMTICLFMSLVLKAHTQAKIIKKIGAFILAS